MKKYLQQYILDACTGSDECKLRHICSYAS
jgi:hypothetical protein